MPSGKDRNIPFINRRLSVAFITWANESKESLGLAYLAFVVSFDFQVCKQCDLEVHFINETCFACPAPWLGFLFSFLYCPFIEPISWFFGTLRKVFEFHDQGSFYGFLYRG